MERRHVVRRWLLPVDKMDVLLHEGGWLLVQEGDCLAVHRVHEGACAPLQELRHLKLVENRWVEGAYAPLQELRHSHLVENRLVKVWAVLMR